jgi:hypothetical protein
MRSFASSQRFSKFDIVMLLSIPAVDASMVNPLGREMLWSDFVLHS